jgi:hypothetical protein
MGMGVKNQSQANFSLTEPQQQQRTPQSQIGLCGLRHEVRTGAGKFEFEICQNSSVTVNHEFTLLHHLLFILTDWW